MTVAPPKATSRKLWIRIKKHMPYYIVIAPVVAFFLIFHYIPMYGVTIAFKEFTFSKGIIGSPWADPLFKYFNRAFSSMLFWRAFWNTLIISVLKMLICFPATILFALLMDEMPGRTYKRFVQTVSFLPHFISWVVLVGVFQTILSPTTGVVNAIIKMFGGEAIYFMADEDWFRPMVLITDIWKNVGYGSVIYIAAIAGVDQEQYEAAYIDGASRLDRVVRITLPNIAPIICIQLILNVSGILNGGFDQIFNMKTAVTASVGSIIDTYVYDLGITDTKYSLSTAIGLFKNVVGLVLMVSTNMIVRRIDPESSLF